MLAHLKTLATWGYELSSIQPPPHVCAPIEETAPFPPNTDIIFKPTNNQVKYNMQMHAWMQKAKRVIISFQYWHDLDQTDSQLKCTHCKILNTQENINSVCIVLRKWSNKKSSEFVGASLYSAAMLQAMNLRNRLEDCIALERLKRWYCPENYDIAHQPWQSAVKLTGQLCLSQPFRQTLKRVICFENLEHIFTM